jgi:beta-phosphoglucomutase
LNVTEKKGNLLPENTWVKAVLFDLDGVILVSMEQHLEAWQHAFKKYNVHINPEDFYYLEGRGVKSVVEDLSLKYNIDPALAPVLMETKIRYYDHIYKAEFYEGFFDLLDFLTGKALKLAIVTGGGRERVQRLADEHFQGVFDCIISSDDVQHTKPFPEPYLKAAEGLAVDPSACVVIENAPLGIRAGKQAGMYVIAIQTTLGRDYLTEADQITGSMREVQTALGKLLGSKELSVNSGEREKRIG